MSDTPETDDCVKESKHIRFLEQDHWVIDRIVTYTHPIVSLCRKLERQLDGLIAATMRDLDLTISERDAAIAERDRLITAIENHKAKAFPLTGEDFDQELWSAIKTN